MTRRRGKPGSWLRALAERIVNRQTLERVILPALADLHHECAQPQLTVRMRAYWGFLKVVSLCGARSLAVDSVVVFSLAAWPTAITLLVGTAALCLPAGAGVFARVHAHGGNGSVAMALLLLLPQALALSLPMAYFVGVATSGRRAATFERRQMFKGVLVGASACAVLVSVILFVAIPVSNQAYRVLIYNAFLAESVQAGGDTFAAPAPTKLPKGLSEMTWAELDDVVQHPSSVRQARLARVVRQQRLAICVAPLVLGLVGFVLAGRLRSPLLSIPIAVAVMLGFDSVFLVGGRWATNGSWIGAAWTANVIFAALALLVEWSGRGPAEAGHYMQPR